MLGVKAITFTPGGASGVLLKSKAPIKEWQADSCGCALDAHNRLMVVVACSMRSSHRCIGKSGCVEHKPAMKWFLKARVARSAAFRLWLQGGTISISAFLLSNHVLFIFDDSLSILWNFGWNPFLVNNLQK